MSLEALIKEQRELKDAIVNLQIDVRNILIERERTLATLVKKEEIYTKNELNKFFEVVANNTGMVKELLTNHVEQDNKRFDEVKGSIADISDEIDKTKTSAFDKVFDVGKTFLFVLIGFGISVAVGFLAHK